MLSHRVHALSAVYVRGVAQCGTLVLHCSLLLNCQGGGLKIEKPYLLKKDGREFLVVPGVEMDVQGGLRRQREAYSSRTVA